MCSAKSARHGSRLRARWGGRDHPNAGAALGTPARSRPPASKALYKSLIQATKLTCGRRDDSHKDEAWPEDAAPRFECVGHHIDDTTTHTSSAVTGEWCKTL